MKQIKNYWGMDFKNMASLAEITHNETIIGNLVSLTQEIFRGEMHYSVPLQIPLGLYHHHQHIRNWPVMMWMQNTYTINITYLHINNKSHTSKQVSVDDYYQEQRYLTNVCYRCIFTSITAAMTRKYFFFILKAKCKVKC